MNTTPANSSGTWMMTRPWLSQLLWLLLLTPLMCGCSQRRMMEVVVVSEYVPSEGDTQTLVACAADTRLRWYAEKPLGAVGDTVMVSTRVHYLFGADEPLAVECRSLAPIQDPQ